MRGIPSEYGLLAAYAYMRLGRKGNRKMTSHGKNDRVTELGTGVNELYRTADHHLDVFVPEGRIRFNGLKPGIRYLIIQTKGREWYAAEEAAVTRGDLRPSEPSDKD